MNAIQFVNEMDRLAEVLFGEFGYSTCSEAEKQAIVKCLLHELDTK
jgi:hypothetical protein